MKRTKTRSEVTLSPKPSVLVKEEEQYIPPLDELTVKVMSIRVSDEPQTRYAVKITFFDQILVTGIVKSIAARDITKEMAVAKGSMSYDPSDYEKMCLFADCPLVVHIQPLRDVEVSSPKLDSSSKLGTIRSKIGTSTAKFGSTSTSKLSGSQGLNSSKSGLLAKSVSDTSCCNIDILPMFQDLDKMCVRKRMEPTFEPRVLQQKSYDNLPLVTLEISAERDPLNAYHHELLKNANSMKFTLVASYNMIEPYSKEYVYTAATKMPCRNENNTTVLSFGQGDSMSNSFKAKSFYPKWENLRLNEYAFTRGDEKLVYDLNELQNESCIDLHHYTERLPWCYTTVWGSFHRTLMLEQNGWLYDHLRSYKWPFEIHMIGEQKSQHFMAHLNLFKLLYPGETSVCMVVPLNWINSGLMVQNCGCDLLFQTDPSTPGSSQKPGSNKESGTLTSTTGSVFYRATGADGNNALVIMQVTLAHPLKEPAIPPHITNSEIAAMLAAAEAGITKRECIGRGQLDREWLSTLKTAVAALGKVPHYGMTEFCNFNRQLSETRTRVELLTSFTNDASIYVNNNFIVEDFLHSEDVFEELLLMSHACLMRITCQMLVQVNTGTMDPMLRAARHARQMQDVPHAIQLYLLVIITKAETSEKAKQDLVVQKSRDADYWRELSTCLMNTNREWGDVCLSKSLQLNTRHPISLLAKGCMVYETDPDAAEIFFGAVLALYPFWTAGWVVISCYYYEQQLYHMADAIRAKMKLSKKEGLSQYDDIAQPRCWDFELGDWWESTPVLPGMCVYYDAADLLLRLRAFTLADVCLARSLSEVGESTAYFHLVALGCRLRGDVDEAICLARKGLDQFGEISYLRALEAECLHKNKDFAGATSSFEKAGGIAGAYSTLLALSSREPQQIRSTLVDLIRRHPNAYAWLALADDWMKRAAMGEGGDGEATEDQMSSKICATACAVQALKWDRLSGRAWALLSTLVTPSARRLYCRDMAIICGHKFEDGQEFTSPSEQSLGHRVGTSLRECRCRKCEVKPKISSHHIIL